SMEAGLDEIRAGADALFSRPCPAEAPQARPWPAEAPQARPWPAEAPQARPWHAEAPQARPWPAEAPQARRRRPRVFFEEWDAPLISGIRWVEELVEIAGGEPIFPELREAKLGRDRIVDAAEVQRRNPEVILASWCGKAVRRERIASRDGWSAVAAVEGGHIYEIKS